MELLIITGMSGAGKSQVVNVLEDIGFYCVDNMPAKLLPKFVELCTQAEGNINRVAIVADARSRALFDDILGGLQALLADKQEYKILFVDAEDNVLIRRYKETRRIHPLISEAAPTIDEAIQRERKILETVRNMADYVINTSRTTTAQLKETVQGIFLQDFHSSMMINCMSFGYKYGLPTEADLVFDVRCLPNPFYIPELKEKTGLDQEVRDYVLDKPESKELVPRLLSLMDYLLPLYLKEGKSQLTIGLGCTGGKHRSVTFAELLNHHFMELGYKSIVNHRDITKQAP